MWSYTLPKCFQGRVQMFWEKIMPLASSYPISSSKFSLKFADSETTEAVKTFEESIGTSDCPALAVLPENTYLANYVGTYDVEGKPGVKTLLSPEPVDPNDNVIVLHYVDGSIDGGSSDDGSDDSSSDDGYIWEQVTDVEVDKNGFVWGTLINFSPIAVFTYCKEIHKETVPGFKKGGASCVVCEGNPVLVYEDEDGNVVVKNTATGTEITINPASESVIGGSVDGSYVKSTNVAVKGVTKNLGTICAGSVFVPTEDQAFAVVGSSSISVKDCTYVSEALGGSIGAVHTDDAYVVVENSTVDFTDNAKARNYVENKDMNPPTPDMTSPHWVRRCHTKITDSTISTCLFPGGGNGYVYIDEFADAEVVNTKILYAQTGGSNGICKSSTVTYNGNCEIENFSSVCRGTLWNAKSVVESGVKIKNLDVLSPHEDVADKSHGKVYNVTIEVNEGASVEDLRVGCFDAQEATLDTVNESINWVKISRSVSFNDKTNGLLGDKLIIK